MHPYTPIIQNISLPSPDGEGMGVRLFAHSLISRHGCNLSSVAVIFPNKRASLWMNDYLLEAAGKPVFAPRYLSITEFFEAHSHLTLADHIQLVSILHKTYCKVTGEAETLDQFFPWGEILLQDFDNVDKSLADPAQVFRNITSLHELDSIDYLSDEQKQLLIRFFQSFTLDHASQIQRKFLALWSNLHNIYLAYTETLRAAGIAYEGMLCRDVAESVSYEDFPLSHYYAVGFNQLLKCEEKLFVKLADKLTIKNDDASVSTVHSEARIVIAQSLTDNLQARYVEHWLRENDRYKDGRRTAVILCDERLLPSVVAHLPSEVQSASKVQSAECRVQSSSAQPNSALCTLHSALTTNSALCTLHSALTYNITAGFPLAETQPASYIATLLDLYTDGLTKDRRRYRHSYLRNAECHPLHALAAPIVQPEAHSDGTGALLSTLCQSIEQIATNTREASELMQEATFRVYNILTRLKGLHDEGYLDIDPVTLCRLYKQILLTATIPFHGEPAKGVQVMGMLETRNLDFDHILMLSCNEGILPKGAADNSAIPYIIKKAFQLHTADERTDIFAHHFYRLLKHCKDVTLVYNSSSSDTSPGEMSRFLLQLSYLLPQQVERISLQTTFLARSKQPLPQHKDTGELRSYIESSPTLSPTAINTYMRCEKQFYYRYFKRLSETADEEDSMDAAAFGSFFHNAAELFYRKLLGERVSADMLQAYIDKPALLEPFISQALSETKEKLYGHLHKADSSGMEHLLKSIVRIYLRRMLINDQKFTPFTILELERPHYKSYEVPAGGGSVTLNIGGIVDRLDKVTDSDGSPLLRVVDYKTGADHGKKKITSVEEMFDETKEGSNYFRQTCLYSLALAEEMQKPPSFPPLGGMKPTAEVLLSPSPEGEGWGGASLRIAPALYYIRNMAIGTQEKYDPVLRLDNQRLTDILTIKQDYEARMLTVLTEMLDKPEFSPTPNPKTCATCPYAQICLDTQQL